MVLKMNKICFLLLVLLIFSGCSNPSGPPETKVENNPPAVTVTPIPLPEVTVNPNEISSYATTLYDKNENRIHNIKTAAEDLNHTVIDPGEVFSFNKTLGKRTEAAGYEKAPILVNGEKETGTGGGVCQVSSTLYNAALDADMEIIERHQHSKQVPYVPKGKDAAVVYNAKDLRFENTKDYPVEILISVSEDEISVSLNKKADS